MAEYHKAPQVTRERLYLDSMQDVLQGTGKVLLDVKQGTNLTYLPLDRMLRPGGGPTGFDPDVVLRPQQSNPQQVELSTGGGSNSASGRLTLPRERGRR